MPIQHSDVLFYTGVATAESGREGRVSSDDGKLDVTVSQPKELGGTGRGTNPEQLFAATYSACFHASLAIVADEEKVDITGSSVTARVSIGKNNDGFGIIADLTASLPGLEPAVAQRLLDKAHAICPYSNMTRNGIEVSLKVG
ncbi:organic hydroperoxide resistance protein [Streptomyces sp. NPDC096323]|jgi:lipoyl-dependent peroxiredoxin|uniref:organic hydroperoxide resistance protein n=1 Tax=Streptomyces sp. NPDC096323 TaxID=3155822 RepID=UPI003328A4ED